jgi:hypothetical protein
MLAAASTKPTGSDGKAVKTSPPRPNLLVTAERKPRRARLCSSGKRGRHRKNSPARRFTQIKEAAAQSLVLYSAISLRM